MDKLGESVFPPPSHRSHLYDSPRNYVKGRKNLARDPSSTLSTQSLGNEEVVNRPGSIGDRVINLDAVAYLVASMADGKSAG